MGNMYLQLIDRARQLPAACRAMGTPVREFADDSGMIVVGWLVANLHLSNHERSGEHWTSRVDLVVDQQGLLYELEGRDGMDIGSRGEPISYNRIRKSVVTDQTLQRWQSSGNGWDVYYAKSKNAIEALL